MLSMFKKLFGGENGQLKDVLSQGAVVVDVRTAEEFSEGHVSGSVNIPLDQLQAKIQELKKNDKIVVCCRSGNRSGQAMHFLQAQGFTAVINGGSWQNVNAHLKK